MCDECAVWRTAYLASLTAPQRTALRALADLSHGYGAAASGATEGWVPEQAVMQTVSFAVYSAFLDLPALLVERQQPDYVYAPARLTEFGAAVVKALAQQEG